MAPKLKVQPAELLGFSFPEAVQVQSSLRQENNPASMSLLAMCYILVNERCLVENQPKAVCSSAVCCFLQTYLYFWVSLQQLFLVILDCIGVWGDKVISTLCCLSKVKVLHKELGPVGAFKKKKKKVQSGLESLQWNCVEQIQKEGAVTQPASFALKETLGIFPAASREDCLCSVSPKGNHQSSKRRKSFLYILAKKHFPYFTINEHCGGSRKNWRGGNPAAP